MLFAHITTNTIHLLFAGKSLLGKKTLLHTCKTYSSKTFLDKDFTLDTDATTSALRELITKLLGDKVKKEKLIVLLPTPAFWYVREEQDGNGHKDATKSAILSSFDGDKKHDASEYLFASYVRKHAGVSHICTWGLPKAIAEGFEQITGNLKLQLESIYPSAEAYYALLANTIKPEKKETITFATKQLGFTEVITFDNFGKKAHTPDVYTTDEKSIEAVLQPVIKKLTDADDKPGRVILSGEETAGVRQDLITKSIGAWVNLLKKVIPEFYTEELGAISAGKDNFPFIMYDGGFGAYILKENALPFDYESIKDLQVTKADLPEATVAVSAAKLEEMASRARTEKLISGIKEAPKMHKKIAPGPQNAIPLHIQHRAEEQDILLPEEPTTEKLAEDSVDEDIPSVLKVRPSEQNRTHVAAQEPIKDTPSRYGNRPFGLYILIFLAAMAIGFATLWFLSPRLSGQTGISLLPSSPTPEVPTPTAVPSPTPTLAPLVKSNLKVGVLNGNGTPGLGNKIKAKLQALGFTSVATGNADSFKYGSSFMYIKPSIASYSAQLVQDVSSIGSFTVKELPATSVNDIQFLIGADIR